MTFDPKTHLTNLKGKDYLEVKWRVVWMRDKHPNWRVSTEVISLDPVLMKASIGDENGAVIATGHGSAQARQGAVWSGREVEKAETAAIGRALALAGYGSQFSDDDEDGVVDSPVDRRPQQQRPQPGNGFKGQSHQNTPTTAAYTNPLRSEPPPIEQTTGDKGAPINLAAHFPRADGEQTATPAQKLAARIEMIYQRVMQAKVGVKNRPHFDNLIPKLIREGRLTGDEQTEAIVEIIRQHEAQKEPA